MDDKFRAMLKARTEKNSQSALAEMVGVSRTQLVLLKRQFNGKTLIICIALDKNLRNYSILMNNKSLCRLIMMKENFGNGISSGYV